jgi:RND superfamily putative drug exporter
LQQQPVERVLITAISGAGRVDEGSAAAAAREVTHRIRELPEVESVGAPVRSADGAAVRVDVTMRGAELDGRRHVEPLRGQTSAVQAAHPGLRVEHRGGDREDPPAPDLAKLDVSDRTHAVVVALERGLLTRSNPDRRR